MENEEFNCWLKSVFDRAVKEHLHKLLVGECKLRNLNSLAMPEHNIVLTISSSNFKMFTFLGVCDFDVLIRNLKTNQNFDKDKVCSRFVEELLKEMVNEYAGVVKRGLQEAVVELGMSTPNILAGSCFEYADELKITDAQLNEVLLDEKVVLMFGYYLNTYGEIVVESASLPLQEQNVSELEFF